VTNADLVALAFVERPLFRHPRAHDAHVAAWHKAVQRQCWERYWTDTAFRDAYEARLADARATTAAFYAANPMRRATV
jgi:hypothetical protein